MFAISDYDLEESLRTMVEAYFPVVESVKNAEPQSYYRQSIDNLVSPNLIGISCFDLKNTFSLLLIK